MFVKVIQCLKGLLLHFNVALLLCQGCGSKLLTLPLFPSGLSDSFKEALPHHPSFVDVRGTPGRGYYVQVLIGTPLQQVLSTHTHTHVHIHAQKHIQMSVLIDTGSSNFAIASSPQRHLHKIFNTSRFHTIHQRLNLHHPLISPTTQFSRLTTSSHPPQLLLLQTRAPENLCVVCTRLLDWLPRCLSHKLS